MAATLVIPEEAITANKCYLCENILSVPPIMAVSLETEQYKCGRCKNVKCTTYTRNTLFENVAKFIRVPCTYGNCPERIPWGLVEQHESECPFRTIECPIYYQKCNDVLAATKFQDHFNEKHKSNLKNFTEGWNLNIKYDYIFLTIVDGLQFFIYILHINDLFSMSVLAIDPITKYKKYSVKLSTVGSDDFSILYENQKIIKFDEREHCYKCIRGCCQTKYHPYSQKNKKSGMIVKEFTSKFKKELITSISHNDGQICYTVHLISEEPTRESTYEPDTTYTSLKDEQRKHDLLRKSIECPICEEYMVAPIFSCETGHTICNVCKPRLQKCPTCQAKLSNSRNFALEELTESIKLPCRNTDNGCGFIGNTNKLYNHELDCTKTKP